MDTVLNKHALSKACIRYARERLVASEKGRTPTQHEIGEYLGVSQSIVSRILGGTEALSKEKLEVLAAREGLGLGELMVKLIALMTVDTASPQRAVRSARSEFAAFVKINRIIDRLVDMLNEKRSKLSSSVPPAMLYKCALTEFEKALHACGLAFERFFVCFQYNNDMQAVFAFDENDSDAVSRPVFVPRAALHSLMSACAATRGVRDLVKEEVIEPLLGAGDDPASREQATFWRHVTSDEDPPTARSWMVTGHRVTGGALSPGGSDSRFAVATVLVRAGGVEDSEPLAYAQVRFAEVVRLIRSFELEDLTKQLSRFCGAELRPQDAQQHSAFYPEFGSVCPENIERIAADFLTYLAKSACLRGCFAYAEIWVYDWTIGEYICPSKYFRLINPKVGALKTDRLVNGEPLTVAQLLDQSGTRERRPRLDGKSAFIMSSRRPLVLGRNPSARPSRLDLHPEVDLGTLYGIPVNIRDAQHDRVLMGVMYVRLRSPAPDRVPDPNPHDTLQTIREITQRPDLNGRVQVPLAPRMTRPIFGRDPQSISRYKDDSEGMFTANDGEDREEFEVIVIE